MFIKRYAKMDPKKKLPEMKIELKYYLSKADFFIFFFNISISFSFQFFVDFDNIFTLVFQICNFLAKDLEMRARPAQPACSRTRKPDSSRGRCRKNGPGSKQGLCHLSEGLAAGSEKFLLDQLGTLELQFHQFRIEFLFLKFFEVNLK